MWDGEQILWELRQAGSGDTKDPGSGAQTGSIGYVHGGDIDAPVAMMRADSVIVLHQSWRGLYAFSTDTTGAYTSVTAVYVDCMAGRQQHDVPVEREQEHAVVVRLARHGPAGRDGLSYRRNRYYDPVSGQRSAPRKLDRVDPLAL